MALDTKEVIKIAHLACLGVDESEYGNYARNLSDILSFVEHLNEVDTDGIVPMAHPMDAHQRLRVDEVTEEVNREQFQAIAPKTEAGLYLVPKVIE